MVATSRGLCAISSEFCMCILFLRSHIYMKLYSICLSLPDSFRLAQYHNSSWLSKGARLLWTIVRYSEIWSRGCKLVMPPSVDRFLTSGPWCSTVGTPNGHLRQAPQSTSWVTQGFTQEGQPVVQAVVG